MAGTAPFGRLGLLALIVVATGPATGAPPSASAGAEIAEATAAGSYGGRSNLTCAALPPEVDLEWRFRGEPIFANSSKYEIDEAVERDENAFPRKVSKLTIDDSRVADHGEYLCVAVGEIEVERAVFLNLSFPTRIVREREAPVKVKNGENATLGCLFEGFNLTEVKWRKMSNMSQPLAGQITTEINDTFVNGALNIIDAGKNHNGTYKCAVIMPGVRVIGERDLLILDRPQINLNFAKAVGASKIFINWTVNEGNSPIESYGVQLRMKENDVWTHFSTPIGGGNRSFVIDDLKPSSSYMIKMDAKNALGRGQVSMYPHWITTLDEDPHFVPVIQIKGDTMDSVTIGWNHPPNSSAEYIHFFELSAKERDGATPEKKAIHSGDSRDYMFDNLNPHTEYIFMVRSCSEWTKECGNWSVPVNGSTMDGLAGPCSIVSFSCETDEISGQNYINVVWNPPIKPNGKVIRYDLALSGNATFQNNIGAIESATYGPKSKHVDQLNTNMMNISGTYSAKFDQLPPNTNFTLQIRTVTRIKRAGEPVEKYCTSPPSVPPRDSLRGIKWIKVRESHGRWMFKLYIPKITERNGAICCYRIFIVKMKNHQRLSDMPSPEHLPISSYKVVHNGKYGFGAYIAEMFTSKTMESDIILGDGTTNYDYNSELINQCKQCASNLPYITTTIQTEDDNFVRVINDNGEDKNSKIPITPSPDNDDDKDSDYLSLDDPQKAKLTLKKKRNKSSSDKENEYFETKNVREFENIQKEIYNNRGDTRSTLEEENLFKLDDDFYVDRRRYHQNRNKSYPREETTDILDSISKDDFENDSNYLGGHKIVSREANDVREGKKIELSLQNNNRAEDETNDHYKNIDILKNSESKPLEEIVKPNEAPKLEDTNIFDGQLDKDSNYTGFVELIVHSENSGKMIPMYSDYFTVLKPGPNVINNIDDQLELVIKIMAVCVLVTLIFLLGLCAFYEHRKRKARHHGVEMHTLQSTLRNLYHGLKGGRHQLVPHNPPDMPPIAKENLLAAFTERQADSGYGFQHEFELLPDCFSDRTMDASEAKENQCKNRYPDIKAYDQTRVKLSQIDSIVGSDYINANFVMGYKERKKFICAQGPTDVTVNDFWRMIWEYNLELVVMLTNLEEYSKVKCSKYWPDQHQQDKLFNNINVHHISEKRYSDYIIRELKITKQTIPNSNSTNQLIEANGIKKNGLSECNNGHGNTSNPNEERIVHQYHFLMWKDFVAPEYPYAILKFIKRMNEASSAGRPVLVHCSAGVGRTGTLVALDCLLQQLAEENETAIFNTICDLRRQRNFLVQSLKQYVFVYRALVEFSQYDDTEIPASRLKTSVDRLRHTGENSDICTMEEEFEKLKQPMLEAIRPCSAGKSPEHLAKNRNESIVPYDHNRVILAPIPTKENSTYINATFIEGYDNSESYIITQDPLPSTIADFWRMVSEQEINTIVMLSELGEGKCPRYWDDDEIQYDHINVTYLLSESCPYYTRREFQVTNTKNQDRIRVTQLQYHGWPTVSGQVPEVTRGLIELLGQCGVSSPSNGPPLLVHCSLGTDRSSMFVALSILTIQLRTERRVDVSTVARKLRCQRMCCLDTFLQYEFLHRAILNYAELHNLLSDS